MNDKYEELERLAELKEKEIITQEEFDRKKSELLDGKPEQEKVEVIEQKDVKKDTGTDFGGVNDYYRKEFKKIRESDESYKGSWNWAAFFFGAFWAFYKGLWLAPLIAIVASILTSGVAGFIYWFIFGARGTYMYYSAKEKDKQLFI